jgi:predicted nucleic acid-binding protein
VTIAVADTSIFIAIEAERPIDEAALPDELVVSVVTEGELRVGVLAAQDVAVRERRLATLTTVLRLEPVPIDGPVVEAWARLRLALREAGRRMPVNDSWIAATAISLGVPIVTQDDDYDGAPGLDVIKV